MLNGLWKCALRFVTIRSDKPLVLRASDGIEELCACWKRSWCRGEVGFSPPWSMRLVNLEQVAVKWRCR